MSHTEAELIDRVLEFRRTRDSSDRDVLGMFAEGLGVAFERNLMMERLQAMRRAADERADRAQPVAEGTVKSHVKHILRKMVAANRTEAVARFHRQRS